MSVVRGLSALLLLLRLAAGASAGLYYSGETLAELPSQWRGFLLDQRSLRTIAIVPRAGAAASPARQHYQKEADRLAQRGQGASAEEWADQGALHVRLGDVGRAIEVLRSAQRQFPRHFPIVANLGTAWQLQGDLEQADLCLQEAVRLAPANRRQAEAFQLRLVRLRRRPGATASGLDDLFGVRYQGEEGRYQPGQLAAAERKKLPADAVAQVQQLALWLPADARLLWQLAELASAHGDVKTAAAIMDGCVTEFGLHDPDLLRHRQLMRLAADELARQASPDRAGAQSAHAGHAGLLRPRSPRPLLVRFEQAPLPPITTTGINPLPWSVLAETALERRSKPRFADHLRQLDGKQVQLTGFMQPLGDDREMASFLLIEYPVGCWYCEMPDMSSIVLVEMAPDRAVAYRRGQVKVVGRLTLNASDPENFLYTISTAKVSELD